MATTHASIPGWTGKALGTAAALVFAPPHPGALIGWIAAAVAVGHGLDLLGSQVSPVTPADRPRGGSRVVSRASLRFTFAALGRIAAASGRVRAEHRQHAERLMSRLAFTPERRHEALVWFDAGRDPAFPFDALARECRREFAEHAVLKDLAARSLCRMAALADTPKATALLFALGERVGWDRQMLSDTAQAIATSLSEQSRARHARELLGVRPGDSTAMVRLAYRRRVARWHPDRLPPDASTEERAVAEERMWRLREALDILSAGAEPADEPVDHVGG